tara:strand:- start:25 stop:213 length:189 start_codon:yes stop_codon:yes gene_type:complete
LLVIEKFPLEVLHHAIRVPSLGLADGLRLLSGEGGLIWLEMKMQVQETDGLLWLSEIPMVDS